jgi:hypothetical protein
MSFRGEISESVQRMVKQVVLLQGDLEDAQSCASLVRGA